MSNKSVLVRNLAAAFLSGPWSLDDLLRLGTRACGRRGRWLRPLVRRVLAAFADRPTGRAGIKLTAFLAADAGLHRAYVRHVHESQPLLSEIFWVPPAMTPAAGPPASWAVPPLPTAAALADWLGLTPAELDWFADCHGHEADVPVGPLRHYTYRRIARASGKWRLLEMPRPRLKALQRRILRDLLGCLPPHAAAHGYRRGCSIVTFAAPHCGRRVVLRFDLRQFFPSVRAARVHALFATAGYPAPVARLLTGLCTNAVPDEVWRTGPAPAWEERQRHRFPHLPQGAPTSPALANLCAYRLDCRLTGLAEALKARYTRYADDLAFSGGPELERSARRFHVQVCRIALEEGFEINTRKTRVMDRGVRQQLVGVVVNARPNVRRADHDVLKATLCNCVRHGPAGQNREGHADFRAHLLGRIAHVAQLNQARGARLRALFDRIDWSNGVSG
jgi:hypothetical protein